MPETFAIVGIALLGALTVVLVMVYPYLALRLRDSREEKKDPELGIKTGYYTMLSTALMLIIGGLTLSAVDIMEGAFDKETKRKQEEMERQQQQMFGVAPKKKDSGLNTMQRVAMGLMVSGLLFSLTFMLILKTTTNDIQFPAPKRVFVGGRLVLAGIVVMVVITALIIMLFQKEEEAKGSFVMRIYETLTAILIVWLPTFIIHVFLLKMYGAQPYFIDEGSRGSSRRSSRRDFVDDD